MKEEKKIGLHTRKNSAINDSKPSDIFEDFKIKKS